MGLLRATSCLQFCLILSCALVPPEGADGGGTGGSGGLGGSGASGGSGGSGANTACDWAGPVVVTEPSFLHVDSLGRLVTRQGRTTYLDTYDCTQKKWVRLNDASGQPISSSQFRARPGGGLVGDATLWLNPAMDVEGSLALPTTAGQANPQWTLDSSDRVWALVDGACPANSTLVTSRLGETPQTLALTFPEILKGTETARLASCGAPNYKLSLHALTSGAVYLVASSAAAAKSADNSACSSTCSGLTSLACGGGDWSSNDSCRELCSGIPDSTWRSCAGNASSCSALDACNTAAWAARTSPFKMNYVYRVNRSPSGELSLTFKGALPGTGGYYPNPVVYMRREPATTDGLTTGIMLQQLGNVGAVGSLDTSAFGLELWNPETLKREWSGGPAYNRGEGEPRIANIKETARKVYFNIYHGKAQEILTRSGSHVLALASRTANQSLAGVASVSPAREAQTVEEADGHFFGVVQGDAAGVEWVQKFNEAGRPAVGTSGSVPPRCVGSSSFTKFNDPCYLAAGTITPNFVCQYLSNTRLRYRCNPTTCLFEGVDCGPSCPPSSSTYCPGCYTATCPP